MDIIVCKFGGSCVADSEGFRRARGILEADPARRYAVVSAPGAVDGGPKVTDLLEAAWNGDNAALNRAADRFHRIAVGLGLDPEDALTRETLRRAATRDALLSRGEYLCARLFARCIGWPLVDAADCVCFDGAGTLSVPDTLQRLRRLARTTPRAVIPGFYGADPSGEIVTLPRNGSDITGALVAAGTGADLYENWTDVPGLMTADPAQSPEARLIPAATYPQMRRLAQRGARVLHPDCLAPVEQAGIPTHLMWFKRPDRPGTVISGG